MADKVPDGPIGSVSTLAPTPPPAERGGERDQPSLSLPKPGGALRGSGEKAAANPATGAATLSLPVPLTPGRGPVAPALTLAYDSGAGNGPFGLGWSLSTPSISRRTDKGLPQYRDTDVYQLTGVEDLVPALAPGGTGATSGDGSDWTAIVRTQGGFEIARYRPRTESSYARIERWRDTASGDTYWQVTGRDNVTGVFGRSPAARIVDPDDPTRVYRWLLEESSDDLGNVVRYEYKAEDGAGVDPSVISEAGHGPHAARYLKRITYGNTTPGTPDGFCFEAVFDYGDHDVLVPTPSESGPWSVRADPFSSRRPGFELRTYRLCRRVLMFHTFAELGPDPVLVRSLDLLYDQTPLAAYLQTATERGYTRSGTGYSAASLPATEFGYSQRVVSSDLRPLTAAPSDAPVRLDATSRWFDLDAEGVAGILAGQAGTWHYRPNLGEGSFGPPAERDPVPDAASANGWRLLDLAGDGRPVLASLDGGARGFFGRADGVGPEEWTAFTAFDHLPSVNWDDPNLRFVDLTGDGLADVLITADDALVWHASEGFDGFGEEQRVAVQPRERLGPRLVFADAEQSVYLADMTGDGLTDLVRVRNGSVDYWPALGYGRFGGRISMAGAPVFDQPDRFDQRRVRLHDVDGSAPTDLLYLGDAADGGGVRVWFNEAGNSFSAAETIAVAPPTSQVADASVADVFGRGTACLVFTEPRPDGEPQAWAVDLMAQGKPHLLVSVDDRRGSSTTFQYQSSTQYYLADKAAGQPWATRLPFPVQVVAQITVNDLIADTTLVSTYAYRHGYYDGTEREFRGFGYVEQRDALADATGEADQPPAVIRRWQHTGWYRDSARITTQFAHEYWQGGAGAALPDTALPPGLTPDEEREAARALRGRVLREEVYAEDGDASAANPYQITESNYGLVLLQPQDANPYCVVAVNPGQSLSAHSERQPDDARTTHSVTLDVDEWGNVLRSVEVCYPRKSPLDPAQGQTRIAVTEHTVVNDVETPDRWRIGVPVDTRTYEAAGFAPQPGKVFAAADLAADLATAASSEVPYQDELSGLAPQRRMIARSVQTYSSDDLSAELPDGQIGVRALPWRSYRQAFAAGHVTALFGTRVTDDMMRTAGYVQRGGDTTWWTPSARHTLDPARFYQPTGYLDPFGSQWSLDYDAHTLALTRVTDPLGNTLQAQINYRVLQPWLLTDANGNRAGVRFDALGMVMATAVLGKPGAGEGDVLDLSTPEPSAQDDPTVTVEYTLDHPPTSFHTSAREQHGAANPRWQEIWTYVDGSGRTILTKHQAAPADPQGPVRWIGTGRVVFNNKGNPIKQYEPYFAADGGFDTEPQLVQQGVTQILRYDPLSRVIRTDQPDGSFARTEFTAWEKQDWDRNDTVLSSRWYADRVALPEDDPRRRAAELAAAHAGTPTGTRFDTMGRAYATIADNGGGEFLATFVELDIEGNHRAVTDPRGVLVVSQDFDMLGHPAHTRSPDAGERWSLLDVTGKTVFAWDARATAFSWRYDATHRVTHAYATMAGGPTTLRTRTYYGESLANAADHNLRGQICATFDGAGLSRTTDIDFKGNPLGAYRRLTADPHGEPDWSALATVDDPDQALAAAAGLLEATAYPSSTQYDALNRVTLTTSPDGSATRPSYDQANLLIGTDVQIRGAADWTPFVSAISHNARGDRLQARLGCGATLEYGYEPDTFRLAQVDAHAGDGRTLQSLAYTYDPVGNVVEVDDAAQQTLYFANAVVSPNRLYTYQPTYRLATAEGREHIGQTAVDQPGPFEQPPFEIPHANDAQAMRRYVETYVYDPAGNIQSLAHAAGAGSWTRLHDNPADGNRLRATSLPGDAPGTYSAQYSYDAAGNMIAMPHLPRLDWDAGNRFSRADLGGGGVVSYQYDASGQRVRATIENGGTVDVRVYLGNCEIYRRTVAGTVTVERETLHVSDGAKRIALVETITVDGGPAPIPAPVLRYQLDDHLGSAVVEVDQNCALLSYEEYHPYGTTSFRSAAGAAQTSLKRYRFTGRERDVETGLYHHGNRYYACWIGRWTSADPIGIADGTNTFAYVHNNPVRLTDPTGTASEDEDRAAHVQQELASRKLTPEMVRDFDSLSHSAVMAKYGFFEFFHISSATRSLPGDVLAAVLPKRDTTVYMFASGRTGTADQEQAHRVAELNVGTPIGAIPRLIARAAGASEGTIEAYGRLGDFVDSLLPVAGAIGTARAIRGGGVAPPPPELAPLGQETAESAPAAAAPVQTPRSGPSSAAETPTAGPAREPTIAELDAHFVATVGEENSRLAAAVRADPHQLSALAEHAPRLTAATLRRAQNNGMGALKLFNVAYGQVLEKRVALRLAGGPYSQHFQYLGGANRPDFRLTLPKVGAKINYDITTPRDVDRHLARPYGEKMRIVTYDRPSFFN
ncbi:RHS repeat-associated protein [Catenulispora sp. EB89]|uniref:SpvB/TcaC N-terminal domain-containing protein n=1 Tax=Catenulispora sp. EB89 TaxID=3156257 RepID=UPI003518AF22